MEAGSAENWMQENASFNYFGVFFVFL